MGKILTKSASNPYTLMVKWLINIADTADVNK